MCNHRKRFKFFTRNLLEFKQSLQDIKMKKVNAISLKYNHFRWFPSLILFKHLTDIILVIGFEYDITNVTTILAKFYKNQLKGLSLYSYNEKENITELPKGSALQFCKSLGTYEVLEQLTIGCPSIFCTLTEGKSCHLEYLSKKTIAKTLKHLDLNGNDGEYDVPLKNYNNALHLLEFKLLTHLALSELPKKVIEKLMEGLPLLENVPAEIRGEQETIHSLNYDENKLQDDLKIIAELTSLQELSMRLCNVPYDGVSIPLDLKALHSLKNILSLDIILDDPPTAKNLIDGGQLNNVNKLNSFICTPTVIDTITALTNLATICGHTLNNLTIHDDTYEGDWQIEYEQLWVVYLYV